MWLRDGEAVMTPASRDHLIAVVDALPSSSGLSAWDDGINRLHPVSLQPRSSSHPAGFAASHGVWLYTAAVCGPDRSDLGEPSTTRLRCSFEI